MKYTFRIIENNDQEEEENFERFWDAVQFFINNYYQKPNTYSTIGIYNVDERGYEDYICSFNNDNTIDVGGFENKVI